MCGMSLRCAPGARGRLSNIGTAGALLDSTWDAYAVHPKLIRDRKLHAKYGAGMRSVMLCSGNLLHTHWSLLGGSLVIIKGMVEILVISLASFDDA